jgi:seryl-tRNA synthetase
MTAPPDLLPNPEVQGVYGRGECFERVLTALDSAITSLDADARPIVLRFPPVMARRTIEQCGYLHTFPHLLGSVYAFDGDSRSYAGLVDSSDAGRDWSPFQQMTDVVLTPAACYAVYPHFSGTLQEGGLTIDVESWCFRQEPSNAPERMRSFRMREFVRLGSAETVRAWREAWIERAQRFLHALGLEPSLAPASDPFFGDAAAFLRSSQQEQKLKFELSVDVGAATRVACISCNYHLDHFGSLFGICMGPGRAAHSACVGFGLERLTLALLFVHGASPVDWPASVRDVLRLPHG